MTPSWITVLIFAILGYIAGFRHGRYIEEKQ